MVSNLSHSHYPSSSYSDCRILLVSEGHRECTKTHTLLGSRTRLLANPQTPFSSSHPRAGTSPKRRKYPAFRDETVHVESLVSFLVPIVKNAFQFRFALGLFDGRPRLLNDGQTILSSLLLFNMAFPFSVGPQQRNTHTLARTSAESKNPSHKHTNTLTAHRLSWRCEMSKMCNFTFCGEEIVINEFSWKTACTLPVLDKNSLALN